ncbi:hypothetical protein [Kitasatospora sp. NPDC088134]|uniref:hypothetical protein n=1 Tax=Kitasatospora sp. NPDC088134 TaxID=3364071 RepID=UPI00381992A5
MSRWTFWDLPGWHEDERLRSFYKHAFSPFAYYEMDRYKGGATEGSAYSERLRVSMEHLLEHRPATIDNWLALSGTQYYSEDELYGYLAEVYAYFFEGVEHQPMPPDPERLPPSDDPRFWSDWVVTEVEYLDDEEDEK